MPVPPLHSNYPHTSTLESAHSVWDQLRTEDRTSFPAVDDRPEQRIRFPAPSSQADWLLPLGLGTHLPFTSSSGAFIEPLRRVTASTARGSERGRWATDSFSTSIQAPNPPVHERWLYDGGSPPELSTSSSRYAPANNAMPPSFAAATAPSPSLKRQTAPHSVSNYTTEAAKPFLVGPVLKQPDPAVQLSVLQEPLENEYKHHVLATGAFLSHSSPMPFPDWRSTDKSKEHLTDEHLQSLPHVLETMRFKVGEHEEMLAKFHTVLQQVRANCAHQLRLCHPNEFDGPLRDGVPGRTAEFWIRQIFAHEAHPRSSLHASCRMQAQLACCSIERKTEIIQAVQLYIVPLSEHQHGNWLVQKAIKAQPSLVLSLLGNCLALALSDFGYHVLVYAIKASSESYARSVVDELLSQKVYETFRTKSAIHVWQQALEVDWVEQPMYRQHIIDELNTALRGRWAEVARSDWGSILLQSWFESASEDEKYEAVSELLAASPALLIHPRSVWVMEHILKHGTEDDRNKILECIAQHAVLITQSQYGHKVIAEAILEGDVEFIRKYAVAICASTSPSTLDSASSLALGGMPSGGAHLSPAAQMDLNVLGGNSTSHPRPALVDLALRDPGGHMVSTLLSKCDMPTHDLVLRTVARNSVFLRGDPKGLLIETLCQRRARASKAMKT